MTCDIVLADETGAFVIAPAKLGLPDNNQVIPEAELEQRTYLIVRAIASRSAAAVVAPKQAIHELSDVVTVSPNPYERLHGLHREASFGAEYHESIEAFQQKRAPDFAAARARAGAAAQACSGGS